MMSIEFAHDYTVSKPGWISAAKTGQGGLLAIAVVLLITLTIGGGLLGVMSQQNANQAILMEQNAQAYYAAQAGVQEALATRMLPRSNYLNFNINNDNLTDGIRFRNKAYYANSGTVSTNFGSNPATDEVIAKYRYMILGGDSAGIPQSNGFGYFDNAATYAVGEPKLLSVNKIPEESPFIIISEGIICRPAGSRYGLALSNKFATADPKLVLAGDCQANNSKRDQVVVVTQVNLDRPNSTNDRIVSQQIFKDPNRVTLPTATFVPGVGWRAAGASIKFDEMWNAESNASVANKNSLTLKKVVVYKFTDNKVLYNCNVQGLTALSCNPSLGEIPLTAVAFRLYFNGPIDFRSISPRTDLSDTALAGCKPSLAKPFEYMNCNIRITSQRGKSATTAKQNTIIPLLPGGTQVIVLPPLNAFKSNERFFLEVDTENMRSFNAERGPLNYSFGFIAENT